MLAWPLLALSLLLPQEATKKPVDPEKGHCQYAHGTGYVETPSIFKEERCMGSIKMPGKPTPMPTVGGTCPDCGIVAGRIPLNPESFGKPFLGATSNPPSRFEGYTGVPVRINVMFNSQEGGWPNFEGGWWVRGLAATSTNPTMMTLLSHSLIPKSEGVDGQGLGKCAAGQFNEHFKNFGRTMKARGVTSIITRPGWEFTLDWPWGTMNRTEKNIQYKFCFQNYVASIQSVYPENKFIYEWNVHQDGTLQSMQEAWPGNEFVDVVATDIYDAWMTSNPCAKEPNCRWENRTKKILDKLKGFADEKGKPIGISELGVWTDNGPASKGRGGGDNPVFMTNLCNWVKDEANHVLYYAYFDEINKYAVHSLESGVNGRSLAAFRANCVGNPGNPHEELGR